MAKTTLVSAGILWLLRLELAGTGHAGTLLFPVFPAMALLDFFLPLAEFFLPNAVSQLFVCDVINFNIKTSCRGKQQEIF